MTVRWSTDAATPALRVVGLLGRPDRDLHRRFVDLLTAGLVRRLVAPGLTLWSSTPLRSWHGRHGEGLTWSALCPRRRPTNWVEASDDCEALGVEVTRTGATLHAASLGMQPLYVRRFGNAVAFAPSIDDLCRLGDGPLHADWTAWASIISCGSPHGWRTPFEEVERMPAGAAWHFDRASGRLTRERRVPPAVRTQQPAASAYNVVETLYGAVRDSFDSARQGLAGTRARRRSTGAAGIDWTVTLSGGWDSRLLAGCSAPLVGPERMTAYTTSPDDGLDLDLAFSAPVARRLRVRHEIQRPRAGEWPAYAQDAFRRVEYQTPYHVWLEPLASRLRTARSRVLDGIGGDVLLKNLLVGEPALSAADSRSLGTAMWSRIAMPPAPGRPWVGDEVAAEVAGLARPDFEAERARFAGHPAEATLTVLATRTARCVALSPFALFAPEAEVGAPFLAQDVLGAALSVPLRDKANGDFYRACLRAVNPVLAGLPSTNDPGARPPAAAATRSSSAEAMAWSRQVLADLAVRHGHRYRHHGWPMPDPVAMTRTWGGRTWLHTLLMLGCWLDRYESRLAGVRPPWW